MPIQITEKKAGYLLVVLVLVSLLHTSVPEAAEFYLTVGSGDRKEHCDSLQIKANKVSCLEKRMVINYDLSAVKDVKIINKETVRFFSKLTPDSIEKINSFNQHAKKQPIARSARSVKKKKKKRSRFTCQGKTRCRQMRSCAEATFYIKNCPGTKMDGNHDGVPCERQWCK